MTLSPPPAVPVAPIPALVLAAAAPGPAGPPLADAVLRGLAGVSGLTAPFTEEKTVAGLGAPLVSHGTLTYRRPDFLEKRTTDPDPEDLRLSGHYLSITGSDAPRAVDLDGQPQLRVLADALRAPLAGDAPALRRRFAVSAEGDAGRWRLTLVPLAPGLLRRIDLAGAGGRIGTVRLVQANGDVDETRIAP